MLKKNCDHHLISTQVKYEVDLDLANRDGKKLPEGSRVEYRKEAYDPLTAVDGVIVKVDEKKECKACGRQFLTPFPDICPDCYVECKPCPSEERCGWTCKPCVGVLKTGEPCTRDENCPKCVIAASLMCAFGWGTAWRRHVRHSLSFDLQRAQVRASTAAAASTARGASPRPLSTRGRIPQKRSATRS